MTPARIGLALMLVIGSILAFSAPASAHTDFETSSPTDGAVVEEAVTTIELRFSKPVVPVGTRFEIFTPTGAVIRPDARPTDPTAWVIDATEVTGRGIIGVRYEVADAEDGHVLKGSFSFTVGEPPTAVADPLEAEALAAFLDYGNDDGGPEAAGGIGRRVELVALLVAIGLTILALTTVDDDRAETVLLFTIVAFLGFAVLFGAIIELYGLVGVIDGSAADVFGSAASRAPLLRLVAAVMILSIGWSADRLTGAEPSRGRIIEGIALGGLALGVVSFAFDGHTVSQGPRVVHAFTNSIHALAAGTWLGGLIGLVLIMYRRIRAGAPAGAAALFIRFSLPASVALGLVIVAGTTMAFFILDRWGDLAATPWGRRLVAKLVLVSIVAAVGGYNHFRVRPRLEQSPTDPRHLALSQRTVLVEAALLLVVAVVTASMVSAPIS